MINKVTRNVLISIILAILAGLVLRAVTATDADLMKRTVEVVHLPADIFLNLVKMIIAPLVFSTLVFGIAHANDSSGIGRIGARAMAWFLTASLASLAIGLVMANVFQPGRGIDLRSARSAAGIDPRAFDLRGFVLHVFPTSMTEAMVKNEILQIVVISLFVGFALCAIGEKGKPLLALIEAIAALMLKVTGYVMVLAPLAVFSALASTVILHGAGILTVFARLIGEYYLSLGILWVLLLAAGAGFLQGAVLRLVRDLREPLIIAFSTASSEAAFPKLMEQLDRFGVSRRVYSFVLPLGYSFNLDGSMMSMTFTTLFITQAYGISVPLGTQVIMLLMLMVTSKGVAGVPRASLVIVAATLSQFGLPVEGVAFVLAIDQFMDMGRTATNVLGNAIATTVVGKWESEAGSASMYREHVAASRPFQNPVLSVHSCDAPSVATAKLDS